MAIIFDAANLKDSAGARVYLGVGASGWYTEATHSWYTEDVLDPIVLANIQQAWYDDADNHQPLSVERYAGPNSYTLDDRPAPIAVHYPGDGDLTGDPFQATSWLGITHNAVNVHKPAGVARPSLWVGSGGLTITAQTDSTITFMVANTATAPALTRTLTSRYWVQMDRLAERANDPDNAHDADWPIKLKANIDASAVPAGDPLLATLMAAEDVTNFDNFSYLKVRYTSPRTSTLTLVLSYVELLDVSDPCYTSFDERFGENGTWEYTKAATKTATYSADYIGIAWGQSGTNSAYLDLRSPVEGELRRGALQHVETLTITGFAVPPSGSDTWSIDGSAMELCDGPVGTQHLALDEKRPWDWVNNTTHFAGWHDGAPILAIQYGYEQFEAVERGLKGTQFVQSTASVNDPSYSKTVARLAQELDWQEGFAVVYDDATLTAALQDADGNAMFATSRAYWWWLKYEPDAEVPFDAAPTVRTVTIERGVPYCMFIRHYVDCKAHGIVRSGGTRLRMASGAVEVKSRETATGATATVGTYDTDAHGRWVSDPLFTRDYSYYINGGSELGVGEAREWMAADAYAASGGVSLCEALGGIIHKAFARAGLVYVQRRTELYGTWEPRRCVGEGLNPAIAAVRDGALRIVYELAGVLKAALSKDGGRSWS